MCLMANQPVTCSCGEGFVGGWGSFDIAISQID